MGLKPERRFLRSRLARRIFWLFAACALLPISILAGVTLWNVASELQRQGKNVLRQLSHEAAMTVYDRLLSIQSDLRLLSMSTQHGVKVEGLPGSQSEELGRRFRSVELHQEARRARMIVGDASRPFDPTETELEHLRQGGTVVRTTPCRGKDVCVEAAQLLDAKNPRKGLIVAEIQPSYLWRPDDVAEGKTVLVFDANGRLLYGQPEAGQIVAGRIGDGISGHVEWSHFGKKYDADYWSVFLKPQFSTDHWTLVVSESRSDLLAPLTHFQRIFVLVVLLALWIVLLFSLVQIRRSLVPLQRLEEGTRKIAAGDFAARVRIRSADEFEQLGASFNQMAGQIDRQFHLLGIQNEIDRAILSSRDVEQMVERLLEHLPNLLDFAYAGVVLLDPHHETRAVAHVSSASADGEREVSPLELREDEREALTRNPHIEVFALTDKQPASIVPLVKRGMEWFMVAPIVARGRLAAVLTLGHAKESVWSEKDKQNTQQLADQIGVALANASLVSELKQLNWGTLTALARAVDAKSHWTAGHSERVTSMAVQLGKEMQLPADELEVLHRGGLLHDIGKIGVPNHLLDKPGALTESEMKEVQEHVNIGGRILDPIPGFQDCMPIVMQHHEWYSGGGYPKGLQGDEITLHARIFAVADCFDALISDRPYREGLPLDKVLSIIQRETHRKYDPVVVEALLRIVQREELPASLNSSRTELVGAMRG